MSAEDIHYDPAHAGVQEAAVQRGVGYYDAEDVLRGQANRGDLKARAVIDEVDAGRARRRKAREAKNAGHSAALGLSMDAVAELVRRLAADKALYTWLCSRVNRTAAYQSPLAADQ